jgi:hypothetical protein
MTRVNLAYEVLSNVVDRVAHDLQWRAEDKSQNVARGKAAPRAEEPSRPTQPQPVRPTHPPRAHPTPPPERRSWADPLSALKRRVQQRVEAETKAAWADLQSRSDHLAGEFRQRMRAARIGLAYRFAVFVFAACVLGATKIPWLWLGVALSGLAYLGKLSGPRIQGRNRPPLSFGETWLAEAANAQAADECSRRAAGFQRYQSELASIAELVLRPSTFDDSESQVARRITTAFFVLGYLPVGYSASDRTLLLAAGDEQVLVRFRHRSGAAVNISYVEKLVAAMRGNRIKRGYLFCSPGLSGNAARFAEENNVRWYTIETMSQWIDDALTADYDGPEGDILKNIDTLGSFLGQLSNALPSHAGSARPRRRRWRRW